MPNCFVCSTSSGKLHFKNIASTDVPTSKKPIKSVLLHLGKFMKSELKIPLDACVCTQCFQDLVQYDEFVIKLLSVQSRLTEMIENSVSGQKSCSVNNSPEEEQLFLETTELYEEIAANFDTVDEDEISIPDIDMKAEQDDELELKTIPDIPIDRTKFVCDQCGRSFRNKTRLMQHMQHEHKKLNHCTCRICGHIVKDEEYLDLHMNLHEGKTENECRYCAKRYTRKVNVIRHMQKHWDKKKFQCEKCGLRFSETTVLYNHKLQHEAEEEPLICSVCNQTFKTKRTYKGHMMTHREDRPRYTCAFCAKTFVEKYTLKVHLRTHDSNSAFNESKKDVAGTNELNNELTCIICGCVAVNREQYNQHIQNKHDVVFKV